jgi:hypothetical protein
MRSPRASNRRSEASSKVRGGSAFFVANIRSTAQDADLAKRLRTVSEQLAGIHSALR